MARRAGVTRAPAAGSGSGLVGVALAVLSAAGFASKGVIAKLLYAEGWSADAVVTTRALLSLPIVATWAIWAVGPRTLLRPPRAALLGALGGGCLCYYLGALLDFRALTLIDASVERVLLFSYPSMVVLLYSVLYRRRPEAHVVVALAITYAGILMVVTGLDPAVLRGNAAGAGLVLACALTFALYYLASDRWTGPLGSVAFTFYALAASTACLGAHAALGGGPLRYAWTARSCALLVAIVLLATVIPMLAMAEGVRRLGAPRASVVSTIGPPTTILLGAWLLDERLRPAQWWGVALIVAGILALELARRPARAAA
ncbi:MAG: DMT family transporter [Proteobacteria bacterium]|nr:DMT family transporter [Pseudomonadota bacterium]